MAVVGHVGSAPTIPVWKTSVYLSTLMPERKCRRMNAESRNKSAILPETIPHSDFEMWNPVLELHQPLRLCRPPPELIGQRDLTRREI
jgi:hypothetical protein